MKTRRFSTAPFAAVAALFTLIHSAVSLGAAEPKPAAKWTPPLFRDFVGLNGHTVQFKPELYAPVCRIVRDYHPVEWDLKDDTSVLPEWPFARNRVSWEKVYGSWHQHGLRISACLMFDEMKPDRWKDMPRDAQAYAHSFVENFGPGGRWPFVEAVEIGNEPGTFDDESYRTIFKAMATGIRAGNPRVKIVTCNVEVGSSERYWKSVETLRGFEELYDVLQIHQYAVKEPWPVWRRTYPEDPTVPFLSNIQKLLDWRAANAPDKPVWVTEFGWDSSTQKPDPKGEWAKWIGNTDEEQAQWLVRSFLLFSSMQVERAFVYFFNDDDKPQMHAASGLTRNFQPKPSFHAVAWMLRSLENHRFSRVVQQSLDDGYVFEFAPDKSDQPVIWAAWHPTKPAHQLQIELGALKVARAERMPLSASPAEAAEGDSIGETKGRFHAPIGTTPLLIWLSKADTASAR